jgi:hypothetical protein
VIAELLIAAARPKGGEGVKSGPLGLAAILVLCVAAYFLFKSMSKHLKKVRTEFPQDEPGVQRAAAQDPQAPTSQDTTATPPTQPPPAPPPSGP